MGLDIWSSLLDSTIGKVVDKALEFIPDPVQKAKFATDMRNLDLEDAKQAWTELQAQVNLDSIEAASENWWKAGWRPFFGWVCGAAFAYKFVAQPFLVLVILQINAHFDVHMLPEIDWTALAAVALPMLGISRDRSNEKQAVTAAKAGK